MNSKLIIIICFLIGFILAWIMGGKKKNSEGKYVSNLVIVGNTDTENCNISEEMCYHIHHWMWMGVALVCYFAINFASGYKPTVIYLYIIALYLGAAISEYVFYGNDIFKVYEKCFTNC